MTSALTLATAGPSGLAIFWFALIGVLWVGYFLLEGFDFGVGVLYPFLGRDDLDKRMMINAIGPTWDGNEVWLLTAGGATFAAFPLWYATVFSGFYLALFLILVALIARGMAFEFRGKRDSARWRFWWDTAIVVGSFLPALLWGVAFANFLHGVPIAANGTWVGGFFQLVKPYALLGGLTTLSLFTLHGAAFLGLRTTGDLRERSRSIAMKLAIPPWSSPSASSSGPTSTPCIATTRASSHRSCRSWRCSPWPQWAGWSVSAWRAGPSPRPPSPSSAGPPPCSWRSTHECSCPRSHLAST